jgi:hypothetical protein
MEIMKRMSIITDAELALAQVERAQNHERQRVTGFDAYYLQLITNGFLPGSTGIFPNRALTRELHADMAEKIPDLRFTTLRSVGIYLGQKHFRQLGTVPWRHEVGNGWAFGRLITLRQAWELQQGGWNWPNSLTDWTWNPVKPAEYNRSTVPP